MDTLRIGVVGTGAIGREHIRRLSVKVGGCTVTAVSEIDEEVGRAVARQYGARYFKDGVELINSPDVDAVVVTAWDPAHAKFVLASIKAGKFVFCEKPMQRRYRNAKRLLRRSRRLEEDRPDRVHAQI